MKRSTNYFALLSSEDEMPDDDISTSSSPASSDGLTPKAPVEEDPITTKAENAADPEIPPASGRPLLDKIPAELRLEIFGLVLRSQYSVVNVNHLHGQPWKQGHRLDTSLFAVSPEIRTEAEEVFYKFNTFRVKSLNDDYKARKPIRHLELTGDVIKRMYLWPGARESNSAASVKEHLPNLRTLTFAEDPLQGQLVPPVPDAPGTASQETAPEEDDGLIIVDYGIRRYQTRRSGVVAFIKHFRLVDAVAYARELDPAVTLADLQDRYKKLLRQGKQYEAARAYFVLWINSFELRRATERGVALSESEQAALDRSSLSLPPQPDARAKALLKKVPGATRLLDLSVAEHGEETLEMANEVLHFGLPLPSDMRWRT